MNLSIFSFAVYSAIIAIILFLVNISMYFIFRTIRKTKNRKIKIFLVKLSRKIFKLHIHFAIAGMILISIHGSIMTYNIVRLSGININIIFGMLAYVFLILTIIAGYYRYKRATGLRRKLHRYSALTFAVLFVIHILI